MRSRWRGWMVAIAVALVGAGVAPAAGATEVGVNVAATSGNYFTAPGVISAIRNARPAWVRLFVGWNLIEPAPGSFNTSEIANYQRFLGALPAGTQVDVDVEGTPSWAAGGSSDPRTPPTDDAAYAGFLDYLVNALGNRVSAWEIWNEEDSTAWWTGTPSQYAGLLKAGYQAVRAAHSNATVLVGGLTGNDATYLGELYAAGAQGSFDAVAIHTDTSCNVASPYTFQFNRGTQTINQYFFLGFTAIHTAMVAAGDGAKPIYMTELGWSSTTAECQTGLWAGQKPAGVDPQTQATYLQQAYHCLDQPQYAYVKAAMWFELVDNGNSTAPLDNYGLLDSGYAPKPAFGALAQESTSGDQLTGQCGVGSVASQPPPPPPPRHPDRPMIRVLQPTSGTRYSGALEIAVTAIAPAVGVREITIVVSRTRRVRFVTRGFPTTVSRSLIWRRARQWRAGRHRISVVVVDKLGHVATMTFSVVRARIARHRPRRAGPAAAEPRRRPLRTASHHGRRRHRRSARHSRRAHALRRPAPRGTALDRHRRPAAT